MCVDVFPSHSARRLPPPSCAADWSAIGRIRSGTLHTPGCYGFTVCWGRDTGARRCKASALSVALSDPIVLGAWHLDQGVIRTVSQSVISQSLVSQSVSHYPLRGKALVSQCVRRCNCRVEGRTLDTCVFSTRNLSIFYLSIQKG